MTNSYQKESKQVNTQEKMEHIRTMIRLSKLRDELRLKVYDAMSLANSEPTAERVDEAMRMLSEWELVQNELQEVLEREV